MSGLNSESMGKVAVALIAAQGEFKAAVKDSTNPAFKSRYVSLDGVLESVSAALRSNGLALVQQTDRAEDGTTVLLTRLIHTSGEWLGSVYPVRPVKPDPQGEGSALTYARRYSLMALVGIAPEDDDGNAASKAETRSGGRQSRDDRDNGSNGNSAPAPDVMPDAGALRSRIAAVGKARGLTVNEIGDDFTAFAEGTPISGAGVPLLCRYIDYLNSLPVPQSLIEVQLP